MLPNFTENEGSPGQVRFNGGDFEVFAFGPFTPEQIRTTWRPGLTRRSDPRVDSGLDACWAAAQQRAAVLGIRPPYDGHLCRLRPEDARVRDGVLTLEFGPCTYREHLGTNLNREVMAEIDAGRLSDDVL